MKCSADWSPERRWGNRVLGAGSLVGTPQCDARRDLSRRRLWPRPAQPAEIGANYFTLRGYDAQAAIYKLAQIQGQRQVTEQSIAILLNMASASFTIEPLDDLLVEKFTIPRTIPSTLLERRPDIAGMERQMAQANRVIGIARAAFYPNVSFRLGGGYENDTFSLIKAATSLWSYGSAIALPVFQGGYRRAQLQQAWSAYRETEDRYRSTVLNAFREVENNLSLTNRLTLAANHQDAAVGANFKTQNLTTELYKGGLASSLELIYAQVATLTARIDSVQIKAELLRSSVALIRALGGGWNRNQLPNDEQIQPFNTFQYTNLDKPLSAGGINVKAENNWVHNDLTTPTAPRASAEGKTGNTRSGRDQGESSADRARSRGATRR
jgi:outer membrane protein, multidrug efflux system